MEYQVNDILIVERRKTSSENKKDGADMKKVQIGWEFKGKDIISEDYCREHFFPGYVLQRGYVSRNVKRYGIEGGENMYDVVAQVQRYSNDQEMPQPFEILKVVRMGGKIIETKILKPEKLYEEVDEEIDEN